MEKWRSSGSWKMMRVLLERLGDCGWNGVKKVFIKEHWFSRYSAIFAWVQSIVEWRKVEVGGSRKWTNKVSASVLMYGLDGWRSSMWVIMMEWYICIVDKRSRAGIGRDWKGLEGIGKGGQGSVVWKIWKGGIYIEIDYEKETKWIEWILNSIGIVLEWYFSGIYMVLE